MSGAPTERQAFLTFFVGGAQYAADAADVAEVFRRPRITRVPGGPPSLLGVTGLRGAPAPVISLARLLGGDDAETDTSRLLLLTGAQPIGLTVDRVGALASMPVAADGQTPRQGFGRLYAVEGEATRVLDLEALIARDFSALAAAPRRAAVQAQEAAPAADAAATVALLGFELAGQAYALPLEEVEEVMPLPPALAVIAQSDDVVLGVAGVRGGLLPIVSLRRLLGLPAEHRVSDRVVIARLGEARVGLAVDSLAAILRAPEDAIDPAPAVLNRGEGSAQVEAICRRPGAREGEAGALVAILSAKRLFSDGKTAHILADGRNEAAMTDAADDEGAAERFIIFRLGAEEYGLPLASVDEVARLPDTLTRAPRAPAFIEGVMSLRGKVVPVIDQRRRFESAPGRADARARIVVTTVDGRQAGFIVDAVSEILPLTPAQIEATPELTADTGRLFSRIATLDGGARLILLVEPRELLDRAERDLLAAMDSVPS